MFSTHSNSEISNNPLRIGMNKSRNKLQHKPSIKTLLERYREKQ